MKDADLLIEKATEFHGHLGPFLVIGIRMGLIALERLNTKGFRDLEILAETGQKPPISCLIDGLQISTGCTAGKGNLKILDNKKPGEKTTERIMNFSDDDLFLIE